jgi:hypothetical protein
MRFLALLVLGIAMGITPASSGPGYLAVVGPSAIRFRLPYPLIVRPLPSSDAPQSQSQEALIPGGPSPPPATASPQQDQPIPIDPGGTNATNPPLPVPSPDGSLAATREAAPIAPQMFLQFFTQPLGSNRTAIVTVPLDFSPASPPVTSSSSATYISPPKP